MPGSRRDSGSVIRTLYHWPLDPGSRQVRIALAEKKLDFAPRLEKPWDEASEIWALSPAGMTPVLVEDGSAGRAVVVEARAILEYLEEVKPEPVLLPGNATQRAEIRRLCHWFDRKYDSEVNAYLLHEKLEKRVQGLGAPDMEAIRAGKEFLRWHLDYITSLLDHREGLAGPRFTLADLVAAAHLSCVDYFGDVPWEAFPAAKGWYERVKCRPSFRPLLEDRLPGMAPPSWYADLDF